MSRTLEAATMSTSTGRQVEGRAGALSVDDGGFESDKLAVLLVHSFGGSSAQWGPQLAHLRATRRAIAHDLRGHGASDAPGDGDYAIGSLAEDVAAVMDGLELERAVLVGHGLGATVVLEYAASRPERVGGLVLAAAPARIPQEQARQMIAGLTADYERMSSAINERLLRGAGDEVRALILRDTARVPRGGALQLIEASLTHDPRPALERYPGPKLAITTPESDSPNDLHRLVPGVDHVPMAGTSHWMQLDRPDEFNRIVDRFLAGIDAGD
jgi:pimeloyl-ACP methyl ester carboxylesterase